MITIQTFKTKGCRNVHASFQHRFSCTVVMYTHAGSKPCAPRLPCLSRMVLIHTTGPRIFVAASHVPVITGTFVCGPKSQPEGASACGRSRQVVATAGSGALLPQDPASKKTNQTVFCSVLFALRLSVCLSWHQCTSAGSFRRAKKRRFWSPAPRLLREEP